MDRIKRLFSRWFRKDRPGSDPEPAEVERLRIEFRERYHSFQLLLSANNKALETMADIERALAGPRPFGMPFVRSRCTAASVNVFRMIRKIGRLAPGKYGALQERFESIRHEIEQRLDQPRALAGFPMIMPLDGIDRAAAEAVGSKMASLGELGRRLEVRVPPGFAITTAAIHHFFKYGDLQTEIDRRFQATDFEDMEALFNLSAGIQQMIINAQVPPDLARAIAAAWSELEAAAGKPITAALRSSAVGEDLAGSSFAGQYRSELNVSRDNLLHAFKEVVASKYSLPAISYRFNRGFRDEDVPMSVGCLAMIDAASGGVIYTCNPVDPTDRSIYINANLGLPASVVDGSAACDLFALGREDPSRIIREEIRHKEQKFVCYPDEGVCRMELTESQGRLPAIARDLARFLAQTALRIETLYDGEPQDIEWALDSEGRVFILQCRPMSRAPSASAKADPIKDGQAEATVVPDDLPQPLAEAGITASPGIAAGQVFLVDKGPDLLSFPRGAVLVARQATPRWATLLNRAAAVVTEQGGFAGHLANVAREFGVPALFSVPRATQVLKNGEEITVDASSARIYQGRIDPLAPVTSARPNPMQGSPVFELLQALSRLIVPLYLLDPEAPEFVPQSCRTLHDITRFIHEKAVHEMFNFGRDHAFSERSSKQLYYHVPMQWWILNLDDGFHQEASGKYVRMEEIASIPMLALWRGFTALPWDGPPALDGKGLMSVFFQATANKALNVGVRSQYAERNYFMISRNFCSLSSRLGFHFSTLEALVSERDLENYISFQFKGGAADFQRRRTRTELIGGILQECGFRVEIREDHLVARLEGAERTYMLQRLEILGYLTLHTRQLDMVMSSSTYVNHYRRKMLAEIRKLPSANDQVAAKES